MVVLVVHRPLLSRAEVSYGSEPVVLYSGDSTSVVPALSLGVSKGLSAR